MPLQATSGAASYDAFGGGVAVVPQYIEDVFSTWLYTGNGSTQTINNGIDLAGKGGLVWLKSRAAAGGGSTAFHLLSDTARGITNTLSSNSTSAQNLASTTAVNSVSSTGFVLANNPDTNLSGVNEVSWTFREQPKFFDVVTYTGNGVAGRTVAHNLGSLPGSIFFKRTDSGSTNWRVYHRSLGATKTLKLNTTDAEQVFSGVLNDTDPTSTVFTVGSFGDVNASGGTYVAYLFAHNAGGFGLTGTDNVISCGAFTTDGSGVPPNVTLGYEPQWIMCKGASAGAAGFGWTIQDNMRGSTANGAVQYLRANSSGAENADTGQLAINSTGFGGGSGFGASNTFIYIAIRRGPMKVPTTGTSVFTPVARTGTGATATVSSPNFPVDLAIIRNRPDVQDNKFADRLRGRTLALVSNSTAAEGTDANGVLGFDFQTGISVGSDLAYNKSATAMINYFFRRAPGFFDQVCYTGTGSARTVAHNLGSVPELMIVKGRTGGFTSWSVYNAASASANDLLRLQTTGAYATDANIFGTRPTSTVFSLGASTGVNGNGTTYVSYLFASCPGVSKVGSYTGNGTSQTINCGFTAGSRFVMIKRTDATGDWYVYDTARGMTTLTDPYLFLNSTAAEVATLGSVTTVSTGFALNSTILADINVSGGTYIFLAIA